MGDRHRDAQLDVAKVERALLALIVVVAACCLVVGYLLIRSFT